MRAALVGFGVVWGALGIIGLAVHAGLGGAAVYVVIWPALLLPAKGLTDSAHGPPFLTVVGVLAVYFLPAVAALFAARARPATTSKRAARAGDTEV